HQTIDYSQIKPFPEPLPVTKDMMDNMMMSQMKHSHHDIVEKQHQDLHTNKIPTSVKKTSSMKSASSLHTMGIATNKDHQSHHSHQTAIPKNMSIKEISMHKMD